MSPLRRFGNLGKGGEGHFHLSHNPDGDILRIRRRAANVLHAARLTMIGYLAE